MTISVIGAGAFGTALAISLAGVAPVTLWARNPDHAGDMANLRKNDRLPGIKLPRAMTATSDIEIAATSDTILLAVPMQQLRALLTDHADHFAGKTLVACCKGIELNTGLGPVSLINAMIRDAKAAILTGPSFAHDIASGLPTALTLACADTKVASALQQSLTTPNLRIYRTTDTVGAELGGALKNVIAIACGATIGAGLGDSARAALMTRGYAEMLRMALALGAEPDTLAGLSGLGDLALTCTSTGSRNYQLGLAIGRGDAFDPSITVEGAATARATLQKARNMQLDMPITEMVVHLLDQTVSITDAVTLLLSRPLKEES